MRTTKQTGSIPTLESAHVLADKMTLKANYNRVKKEYARLEIEFRETEDAYIATLTPAELKRQGFTYSRDEAAFSPEEEAEVA